MNKALPMLGRFLSHPLAILGAVALGGTIGWLNKPLAIELGRLGEIYLALLEMCILPLMIGAIVSGIGSLFIRKIGNAYVMRIGIVFVGGMILVAIITLTIGLLVGPGKGLEASSAEILGAEVTRFESAVTGSLGDDHKIIEFVRDIIPSNVFEAATQGKNLSLLLFSILLGAALGKCSEQGGDIAIKAATGAYEALLKIVGWIMYALPVGLVLIIAGQVAQVGPGILTSMLKLVACVYAIALLLMVFYTLVIARSTGVSIIESFKRLKGPLLISFVSSSSYAAIPSALSSLRNGFSLNPTKSDLILPLGINLNPQGNVVHFVLAVVFVSQIFNLDFGPYEIFIVIVAGMFAAVAAAGAPGIAALGMLVIVFEPLNLPVAIGVALLAAIDPIVDPILTTVNVHSNCATAAVLSKNETVKSDEQFETTASAAITAPN
ncbi:dicarboxylate/amino acid:cation symporter [Saccharophagus degradans]|uniref:dicarboxylate/amino acid:cation symporter n=1 Tax=Saccharophagus degradans TaxID=86304 RepID=UPI001C0A0A90|nr:cation:dicarboxylase symporter family transporter [Saccharophagus degradans]MBU2984642.1 dicarboxylate/amino acid:cation symporter [Saccharophagus degradans]